MLASAFKPETVTRLRATTAADPYSGEATAQNWDAPTSETIETLAPAEPRPSGEPLQNARNSVVKGWTLYLPEGADVTAADRLQVRGVVYSVLGEPAEWAGAGVVVQCERVEG